MKILKGIGNWFLDNYGYVVAIIIIFIAVKQDNITTLILGCMWFLCLIVTTLRDQIIEEIREMKK